MVVLRNMEIKVLTRLVNNAEPRRAISFLFTQKPWQGPRKVRWSISSVSPGCGDLCELDWSMPSL